MRVYPKVSDIIGVVFLPALLVIADFRSHGHSFTHSAVYYFIVALPGVILYYSHCGEDRSLGRQPTRGDEDRLHHRRRFHARRSHLLGRPRH